MPKHLRFSKKKVLFSDTIHAKRIRTLDTRLNFFEFHFVCRTNEELRPLLVQDLDVALNTTQDSIQTRNFKDLAVLPSPHILLTSKFFAIPAPGQKTEEFFELFIPYFNANLEVEVPKGKIGKKNMAVVLDICSFKFAIINGVYILVPDNLNNIISHSVPEEEYGECHIDIRTGLPHPQVPDKYKGPKRYFLRKKSKKAQFGVILRDTGIHHDLVDMTYDLSEKELKKYKSVWAVK